MPEGHSVHRLARQFQDVFAGARLAVSSPQGRFASGAARLDGATLLAARAHGKQLFLDFDNGLVLRVHLGLYGAWSFGGDETFRGASSIGAPRRVGERETYDDGAPVAYDGPPEPVGQVRVRLVSDHGWADLRGPTACEVITPAEASAVAGKLGPDPLQGESSPLQNGVDALQAGADSLHAGAGRAAEFVRRLTAKRTAVGQLLMDQNVVAGVGNIYRAETLFRRGLSPWLPGKQVSPEEAGLLWADIVDVMGDGVRDGKIITTRPEHRDTDPAGRLLPVWPDNAYYVYQRQGMACRVCGNPVALTDMAARKLYWCPTCQPA
ncbi:Fpg/Nei family DNA glycosylase [Arthrobacter sp. CAU 1506]|uniref:Fpg/Nei family DNA glycosylase n=1 Tax=Arthrobacter sp. CAU 1506 TaxID=2560052 RepID=UPI0010AC471A|nr:DNA glycosylase [Arthrobacter sp. CAU 1506]TJY64069.1 Fpg/Nei family DNA glycosylase [Arthrobacter sp. CAU 1506]